MTHISAMLSNLLTSGPYPSCVCCFQGLGSDHRWRWGRNTRGPMLPCMWEGGLSSPQPAWSNRRRAKGGLKNELECMEGTLTLQIFRLFCYLMDKFHIDQRPWNFSKLHTGIRISAYFQRFGPTYHSRMIERYNIDSDGIPHDGAVSHQHESGSSG